MKTVLDGSPSGVYRGDCECGFNWHGTSERLPDGSFVPALPVAEASVHHQMCHPDTWFNLQMTSRFRHWLERYWRRVDSLNGLGQASMTR